MKRFLAVLLSMTLILSPITAFGSSDDTTPPTLDSIALRSTQVYPGGTVLVSADGSDDGSGVKSVTAHFRHETEDVTHTAKLLRSSDGEVAEEYSGVLSVPGDAPTGTYRLSRVVVEDRAGNRATYAAGASDEDAARGRYRLDWSLSFRVVQGREPAAPASCKVTESKGAYTVTFTPGDSRVDKATLLFKNSANLHKYVLSVSEDDLRADGSYQKALDVSRYEPAGTFTLGQVVVKTPEGRQRTWSASPGEDSDDLPLQIAASFAVKNTVSDTSPPVFRAIEAGTGVGDAEDEKTRYPLQVTVTDDVSGVEHITVKFKAPDSGETIGKVLRAADRGAGDTYCGQLSVDFDQEPGAYRLDSVTVCDRAGNRMTYCTEEDLTDKKLLLPVTASVTVQ